MSNYSSLFTGSKTSTAGSDSSAGAAAPIKHDRYRLLFVDDEPNVLKALRRIFRRENYHIETAENSTEALQMMAKEKFHLIISDYKMPGMNGAELLKQIKNLYPNTIRIMLTGQAETGAVMGAINEGAVYKFILKPWNDDDLRITVALALEQHDLIEKNDQLQRENKHKNREINALKKLTVTNRSQIVIMLHKKGLLNDKQLQELYKLHQQQKHTMLKLILERDWIKEKTIREILCKELMFEEVALNEFQPDPAVLNLVPRSFCERQLVVPLKLEGKQLMLAMADPMDVGLIDDLRFVTGLNINAVMADLADIEAKIAAIYGKDNSYHFRDMETLVSTIDPFENIEIVIEDDADLSLEELLEGTEEPPAIRLVNAIIIEAVRLGVSDIHIQPRSKNVVVRYRIDGVLVDKIFIPHHYHTSLVSRIKVMAELDIAERRRPQDGRITIKTPMRIVDLRISTLPTINGEKLVVRILDRNAAIYGIDELGFYKDDLEKVLHIINKPQGIILATGPTGSGKTTTLYSLLQHDVSPAKNYVTLEEPVEFYLDMAGQVNIREKIELTFPSVLKAILRQDPDVILLGEIRDFETAEVAFHAALTGHQVYSTLHTNSAIATIARLFDLGLKPFIVASALEGIIAQRLVRKICNHCREESVADPVIIKQLGPLFNTKELPLFKGRGCHECNQTGYRGRISLFEVLCLDEGLRQLILSTGNILDFNRYIVEAGHRTLLDDAWLKVKQGLTTCEEVLRVLGPQTSPFPQARDVVKDSAQLPGDHQFPSVA